MNQSNEFEARWAAYGKRLDQSLRLNEALLAQGNLSRAGTSLKPLERGLIFEIIANGVALLLVGSFLADSIRETPYAVAGVALFATAWAALVLDVRQLVVLKKIDFDEPVIAIQTSLERLRIQRIQTLYWTLIAAPLLWVPLSIVGLRMVGIDPYAMPLSYIVANLIFAGLVLIAGVLWARRGISGDSRFADILAGRSLTNARAHLDAILRFVETP